MEWKVTKTSKGHRKDMIGELSLTKIHVRESLSIFAVAFGLISMPQSPVFAQDYDMDCKVIICLAGGFPSDCGDAWDYMIDRITDFPKPKPPFDICSQEDGSPYQAVDAPYAYLRERQASGWHCGEGTNLFHKIKGEDHGQEGKEKFE